jgi:hypothetical protein
VKWPWHRVRAARQAAEAAEERLRKVREDRESAHRLGEEARTMITTNGFADAVRIAMGVSPRDRR